MPEPTLWQWKEWGWESTPVGEQTVQIHLPPPVPRGSGFPVRLVRGSVVEALLGHGDGLRKAFALAEYSHRQLQAGKPPTRF